LGAHLRMKIAISIGFPAAGLFVSSWVVDEFGLVLGLAAGIILGINYFFLMRKFR